jgi:hypothetical protein
MTQNSTTTMASDLFEEALDKYQATLKAGLKQQEDTAKLWTGWLNEAGLPADLQEKAKKIIAEAIPAAQKNAEEAFEFIERNGTEGLNLMKKAMATTPGTSFEEGSKQAEELWEEALKVMSKNAETMVQANARTLETWRSLIA